MVYIIFFYKCNTQILINYFSYLMQVCFKVFSVRKLGIHVLERTVIIYISQDRNFCVDIISLEFLYLHGTECLHSQLQLDKISKKKIFPVYQLQMYLNCLHSCSLFFSNSVICLFLLNCFFIEHDFSFHAGNYFFKPLKNIASKHKY